MELLLPLSFMPKNLLLSANLERAPRLHFWLSQDVSASVNWFQFDALQQTPQRVDFELRRTLATPQQRAALATCNLNVDLLVVMANEYDEQCLTTAGCARIPLGALIKAGSVDVPLLMPTTDYNEQPDILPKLVLTVALRGTPVLPAGAPRLMFEQEQIPAALTKYIMRAEQRYGSGPGGIQSTYSSLKDVNLFYWQSRCGVLPAAAYVDVPLTPTKEEYYVNVATLAARRLGITKERAIALDVKNRPEDARLAVFWLAHAVSLYAQYCDYICDSYIAPRVEPDSGKVRLGQLDIDLFEYVRKRGGSGDCEDLSAEMMIALNDLYALTPATPLVQKLQRVARGLVPVMLLDGVNTGEINKTEEGGDDGNQAHMNAALLSRHFVHAWLPGTTLLNPAYDADESPHYPPIAMLEGTGPLEPDGYHPEDPAAAKKREKLLKQVPQLKQHLRCIYYYDSTGSGRSVGFYRTVKIVASPFIARNCFIWMLKPSATARTAGVDFAQISNVHTVAQIKAECEQPFSDAEMAALAHLKRDMHPVYGLEAPSEASSMDPTVLRARAQMEEVARRVGALYTPTRRAGAGHEFVLMAKYAHYDEHGSCAALLERALRVYASHNKNAGFAYEEEQVTGTRGGFRLYFYADD